MPIRQTLSEAISDERTSYEKWAVREGVGVINGYFIEDLRKISLHPWERKGGKGTFICLEGTGQINDAYLCEIPPAGSLKPQRHLFEELIYVLEGRGATNVWNPGESKHTFEWQEGSIFSI